MITETNTKEIYDIAGLTPLAGGYEFTFPYTSTQDVRVYTTGNKTDTEVSTSNYTIDKSGATPKVVFISGYNFPAGQTKLTIIRSVSYSQELDLRNGDLIDADKLEGALDDITQQIQQVAEKIDRAILSSVSDTAPLSIPEASQRSNMLLGFDDEGKVIPVLTTDIEQKLAQALAAEESAIIAKNAAENAQHEAESAQSAAETAQEMAETAQAAAESAETSSQAILVSISTKTEEAIASINTTKTGAVGAVTTQQATSVAAVQAAQNTAESDIAGKRASALTAIDTAKTNAVAAVNTQKETSVAAADREIVDKRDSALTDIQTARTNAVNAITTQKDTSVQEVEQLASERKAEINSLAANQKADVKQYTDGVVASAKTEIDTEKTTAVTAVQEEGDAKVAEIVSSGDAEVTRVQSVYQTDLNELKGDLDELKTLSMKFVEDGIRQDDNYYCIISALDTEKIYAFVVTSSITAKMTIQTGSSGSSSSMIDTLGTFNFVKNVPIIVFGYKPTGAYRYFRMSTANEYSVKVYEVISVVDVASDVDAAFDDIKKTKDDIREVTEIIPIVYTDKQLMNWIEAKNNIIKDLYYQLSTSKFVKVNGYVYFYIELNSDGGTYSYNIISDDNLSDYGIANLCFYAVNDLPSVGTGIVAIGSNSISNKRGIISDSAPFKYLLVGFQYYPSTTVLTEELIERFLYKMVVRKGGYDTTYYPYKSLNVGENNLSDSVVEKLNSKGTDETSVRQIINKTVPAWAMADTKPYYTASDIDAVSSMQGSDNKGKSLIVGQDGIVTLGEPNDIEPNVAVRYCKNNILYVGDNLIGNETEVEFGTNWTGNITDGFTHTTGATDELVIKVSTEIDAPYLIDFNVSTQAKDCMGVTLGNEPYCDPYNGANHYMVGVISDGGFLKIKATASKLSTTITDIKLRKVSSSGTAVSYPFNNDNVNNGQTLKSLTGFWNVAIGGANTQGKNQNGSRNIAIGHYAQKDLKSGTRNISVGTFAMPFVTEGDRNVAIGADTLYSTKSYEKSKAYDNVAIGKATMANGEVVQKNVAIGSSAMVNNDPNAKENVAIGFEAGYYASNGNTAIGNRAGYYTKGNYNVSVGASAGADVYVTGDNNICIGKNAGFAPDGASSTDIKTVSNTVVIGTDVKAKASNEARIGTNNQTLFLCGKKITFNDDGTVTWESV